MPSKVLLQRRTTLQTWLMFSAGKIESLLANPENPPSCAEVQIVTDDHVKFSDELKGRLPLSFCRNISRCMYGRYSSGSQDDISNAYC